MKDLTDQTINGFKVTGIHHKDNARVYWSVICTCGKEREPMREDSIRKHTGRCTCKPKCGDISNGYTYTGKDYLEGKRRYYEVVCSCGHKSFKRSDVITNLLEGNRCPFCRNNYTVFDGVVTMDISSNKHPNTFTTFDLKDLDSILKFRWYPVGGNTRTKVLYVQCDGGGYKETMHRYLLELTCREDIVDHQDGNGLNNCSDNIRVTDSTGNNKNLPIPYNNTSGHMGVSRTNSGNWRSYITVNNRQLCLGTYEDINDAINSRKEAEVFYNFHENHGRTKKEK